MPRNERTLCGLALEHRVKDFEGARVHPHLESLRETTTHRRADHLQPDLHAFPGQAGHPHPLDSAGDDEPEVLERFGGHVECKPVPGDPAAHVDADRGDLTRRTARYTEGQGLVSAVFAHPHAGEAREPGRREGRARPGSGSAPLPGGARTSGGRFGTIEVRIFDTAGLIILNS